MHHQIPTLQFVLWLGSADPYASYTPGKTDYLLPVFLRHPFPCFPYVMPLCFLFLLLESFLPSSGNEFFPVVKTGCLRAFLLFTSYNIYVGDVLYGILREFSSNIQSSPGTSHLTIFSPYKKSDVNIIKIFPKKIFQRLCAISPIFHLHAWVKTHPSLFSVILFRSCCHTLFNVLLSSILRKTFAP